MYAVVIGLTQFLNEKAYFGTSFSENNVLFGDRSVSKRVKKHGRT